MKKPVLLYFHHVNTSFIRKDLALLEKHYKIKKFYFKTSANWMVPFLLIRQYFFLLWNIWTARVIVTQFGGYHSWLPGVFGRIFGKKSLIVQGGSDCVSFPSIGYGNFNKKLFGLFTKWSYLLTDHFVPVHKSLVEGPYTYTTDDYPQQGYKYFVPNAKAGYTELAYGYDPEMFHDVKENVIPDSFLMVGYLTRPNYYRKGVDMIFKVAPHFPDSTFTIVGADPKLDFPDPVPENVQVINSVPYEELQRIYASHEFYLMLSICEGFPSAICEGMLCGCIPIGSDVAAIPEIIGDTGFILEHKDLDQLIVLLKKAMQSDRVKLRKAAREKIMHDYPIDNRDHLIDVIEGVVEGREVPVSYRKD